VKQVQTVPERTCSTETSIGFKRAAGHYVPENRTLHIITEFQGLNAYIFAAKNVAINFLCKMTEYE
jgi:hypothetical protein